MKKLVKLIYVLILFLICTNNIYAETIDEKPPEIKSVTIDKTTYKPGENMTLTIDAEDDISGIFEIIISFVKEGETSWGGDKSFTMNLGVNKYTNGKGTYTVQIPITTLPGRYTFYRIDTRDNAWNGATYQKYEHEKDSMITDFSLPVITIEEYEGDLKGPILKSLTFDKTTIKPGESITMTAVVEDESNIKNVYVYTNNSSNTLTKTNDNTFVGTFYYNSPGTYAFTEIQLIDEYDNTSIYMYKSKESSGGFMNCDNYFTLEDNSYDITVEGTPDTKAPELKNVIIEKKEVTAPSSFYITVIADDDHTEYIETIVSLTRKDCQNCTNGDVELSYKDGNKYIFRVTINQYATPGRYYIGAIHLKDESGNKNVYSPYVSDFDANKEMKEYYFDLVKDTNANVTTSTSSNNIIDIINNSEDNDIISVDTTKNTIVNKSIFEAIQNTNKTISLESNGIRWIFNGNDITNPKDIDISSETFFVEDYNNKGNWDINNRALVIKFKENGILPGKALIKIKVEYTFRDYIGQKHLKLYYQNGENYDLISNGILESNDGYYSFYLEHNSTYFLTNGTIKKEYVKNDYSKELGNDVLNEEIEEEVKETNPVVKEEQEEIENNIENSDVITTGPSTGETNTDAIKDKENNTNKEKDNNNIVYIVLISLITLVTIGLIVFITIKKRKAKKK